MCHRYKIASLSWCCQLLPCSDGEKSSSLSHDKFLKFYTYSHKNVQSDRIYVSVGIVGLLYARARQCTSTPNLREG